MPPIQIAIDGPAGAGKSTVAKALAERLNIMHLDTGAMYRAVTVKALDREIDLNDEEAFDFIDATDFYFQDGELILDGENIETKIRSPLTSQHVSLVASHKTVRDALVKRQHAIAEMHDVVMDGRDIGTVVLPDAPYKFFLTADPRTRAKRRFKDMLKAGDTVNFEELVAAIRTRDDYDSNRMHNPLKKASDAIEIDTKDYSIAALVEKLYSMVKEG
jgi:cytidylate kinase